MVLDGSGERERVKVSTDSMMVDTVAFVYTADTRDHAAALFNDDSGKGLFGLNSELAFEAPHVGEYFVAITGVPGPGSQIGGY